MTSKKKSENSNIGDLEFYLLITGTIILFVILANALDAESGFTFLPIIYSSLYGLFLFVSLFLISGNEKICGKTDLNLAWTSGIFPFSFVFLVGVLLLETFPGWIRGFANTIGTTIVGFMGYEQHIKDKILKQGDIDDKIQYVYNSPIPLFNELTLETYGRDNSGKLSWEQLSGSSSVFAKLINSNIAEDDYKTLANHIKNKNLISYMIWYMALGTITLFMSINNMINDKRCATTTLDQAEFTKAFSKSLKKVS